VNFGVGVLRLCPRLLFSENVRYGERDSEQAGTAAGATIVPSAIRLGDNLIVFPDRLLSEASLEIVGERDPALYVPRP
jgi:hypothetical protein